MLNIDPTLLQIFGIWGSVVAFKLLIMSLLTSRVRLTKKVFSNPEDCIFNFHNREDKPQVAYNDSDVERMRRAHLNDLENIVPWLIVTYVWLWTNPSILLAKILIPSFVIARYAHTVAYAFLRQQPLRAILFFIGYFITMYETAAVFFYFVSFESS